jgi:hypothetical protein
MSGHCSTLSNGETSQSQESTSSGAAITILLMDYLYLTTKFRRSARKNGCSNLDPNCLYLEPNSIQIEGYMWYMPYDREDAVRP